MRPSLHRANSLYLLTLLLILISTPILRQLRFFQAVLFAELLLLIPTMIFVFQDRVNIKRTLRLKWPGLRLLCLSILAALFAYVIATYIAAATRYIYSHLGNPPPMFVPPVANLGQLGMALFIGCLVASIAEEILFRGYLLRAYESFGSLQGVIITGILFGIFHLSLQNLVATAFLGMIMGYLVYRTGSLLAGIVAHFTNNALAFYIAYLSMDISTYSLGPGEITIMGIIAFICLFFLSLVLKAVEHYTYPRDIPEKASIWVSLSGLAQTWPLAIALIIFFSMAFSEYILVFGRL